MKDFENIGKRMPYNENDDYVSQLVSRATEHALGQPRQVSLRHQWTLWAAAAAVVVLIAGAGLTYYNKVLVTQELTAQQETGPIDQFLNGLTDDEAQQLAYYEIEDIPEY